jgi:hypothetical protein
MSSTEFDPGTANTGESKIVSLVLPDTAESTTTGFTQNIGAFRYFTALTSVTGDNVKTIGTYAFVSCTALTEVSLPKAVTINSDAFRLCTALAEISLPMAESIGNAAFALCTSLTKVNLPKAITFGTYSFASTETAVALTVTLGSTVPTVGTKTFNNVSGKTVTIKVPTGAQANYDTAWQNNFKDGGTNINLIIETYVP